MEIPNATKRYTARFTTDLRSSPGADAIPAAALPSGDDMNDYGRKSKISGEDYLSKFFFNPLGTWHGGDWHGGYGVPANFNAYNEMVNFYKDTVKDFRKKYEI